MYLQKFIEAFASRSIFKRIIALLTFFGCLSLGVCFTSPGFTAIPPTAPLTSKAGPLQLFSLDYYDQNIDHWIKPSESSYSKPLVDMSYQKKRLKEFYNHYFSTDKEGLSPWNQHYLTDLLASTDIQKLQKEALAEFSNDAKLPTKIGYGENFHPHSKMWIDKIADNLYVEQFKQPFMFSSENRAILVQNAYARALPSLDPHFYHHELPGQGYPFDNLQMSAVWTGTPVYVLGKTQDKHWSLVVTPDLTGWVQSEAIAKVDQRFIRHWQKAAKLKLAAIIKTETPIIDTRNMNYHFKAYVGSVFPMLTRQGSKMLLLFPVKDSYGQAKIKRAIVQDDQAAQMPLAATPENFVKLIKTLQHRPYGWGGLNFYNDCSAELKSLYTAFGIWLPRHSADQTQVGKMMDKNAAPMKERIEYLQQNGRPFMTIVYNTKHVFMYLGNFTNPNAQDETPVPMTYQNLWGLKPADFSRRAVIGQAVIFPLLSSFKEAPDLNSEANKKDFQVIFLDEWPEIVSKEN